METLKLSDEALLTFLQFHPSFRDRLASIVGAVGNLVRIPTKAATYSNLIAATIPT